MPAHESNHDLGAPIAVGRTAEIYAWKPGWVLKLYFDRYGQDTVAFERQIAKAICAADLPVPAVGELVTAAGRTGLLYERCEGVSMAVDLAHHPLRVFSHARALAELHAQIHTKPVQADIPPLRRRLEHKIREVKPLQENLRTAALRALASMPDGDRLCHGDFHPGNVLLSQPDPVIIDWIDTSIGSPLADVARTSVLALGVAATQSRTILKLGTRIMHTMYLRRYFQLRPGGRDEYHRWLPIVAVGRLNEGISELEPWLLTQASKVL